MSDMIGVTRKSVVQPQTLRMAGNVKLDEERADRDKRLEELKKRSRKARKQKKDAKGQSNRNPSPEEGRHIDFTA